MKRLALACSLLLATVAAQAAKPIPAPPSKFVLDEPSVLSSSAKRSLEIILIEHTRLTQEQIVVAIFEELGAEDLVARTSDVFAAWKIGQKGRDNGVLLALYWKDRKVRIEVGYGLEATLTDAKSKRIIEGELVPGLKSGQTDRAIFGATVAILETLESPLMQSGKLEELLKSSGQQSILAPPSRQLKAGPIVFFLGLIFFVFIAHLRSRRDAHFTRAGWYKSTPWGPGPPTRSRGRSWPFVTGHSPDLRTRQNRDSGWGGWGGGGLGGGGFGGGGGRSGGGGASGSW